MLERDERVVKGRQSRLDKSSTMGGLIWLTEEFGFLI